MLQTSDISILRAHQYYNGIDYQMAAKEMSKKFNNIPASIKYFIFDLFMHPRHPLNLLITLKIFFF